MRGQSSINPLFGTRKASKLFLQLEPIKLDHHPYIDYTIEWLEAVFWMAPPVGAELHLDWAKIGQKGPSEAVVKHRDVRPVHSGGLFQGGMAEDIVDFGDFHLSYKHLSCITTLRSNKGKAYPQLLSELPTPLKHREPVLYMPVDSYSGDFFEADSKVSLTDADIYQLQAAGFLNPHIIDELANNLRLFGVDILKAEQPRLIEEAYQHRFVTKPDDKLLVRLKQQELKGDYDPKDLELMIPARNVLSLATTDWDEEVEIGKYTGMKLKR